MEKNEKGWIGLYRDGNGTGGWMVSGERLMPGVRLWHPEAPHVPANDRPVS